MISLVVNLFIEVIVLVFSLLLIRKGLKGMDKYDAIWAVPDREIANDMKMLKAGQLDLTRSIFQFGFGGVGIIILIIRHL